MNSGETTGLWTAVSSVLSASEDLIKIINFHRNCYCSTFSVFFQEGSYARPTGWHQCIWTAWRLGSFEERGYKQKRNSGYSQLGAGSGILERELQTLPAPGGPCLALCCPEGHWIWQLSQIANGCRLPQREVQGQVNSFMIPALNACSIATVCIYALGDPWREGPLPLLPE